MNQVDEFYAWIKIGFFILMGIILGFLFWHPSNNDYVNQSEHDKLKQDYQKEIQKNEELEKSMSLFILEFYTKEFVFGTAGFKKHRIVFCALQKHLTGEIPYLGELIC